ncbi:MAG: serine/threonine-protein kinase, partial [Planctomycetota bacterium]
MPDPSPPDPSRSDPSHPNPSQDAPETQRLMDADTNTFDTLPIRSQRKIDQLCDDFESQWQSFHGPSNDGQRASDAIAPLPWDQLNQESPSFRLIALRELLEIEIPIRLGLGHTLRVNELETRFQGLPKSSISSLLQQSTHDTSLEGSDSSSQPRHNAPAIPKNIGKYRILGTLGSGGMGTVFHARHSSMQRDVALKMIRRDLASDANLRQRFHREVLAAARLDHPNIVTAYDAGEYEGHPYLVTQFIRGRDLRDVVRGDGPVPWATALKHIRDAAMGLEFAHQQNVIHRDIKPANLLLESETQRVMLLDLGLARMNVASDDSSGFSLGPGADSDPSQLTQSGAIMGTAAYMSPEQARDTRSADIRSDVYSLGCVLHFLLTGEAPFRGATPVDTIISQISGDIPQLPDSIRSKTPDAVRKLLHQMMAKQPEDRPQSMREILNIINPVLMQSTPAQADSVSTSVNVQTSASNASRGSTADSQNAAMPSDSMGQSIVERLRHPIVLAIVGLIGIPLLIVAILTSAHRSGED